ncbi:MAG: hypothetical protein GYB65_21305, partial [Chloroflexi bacterium]|nr:hypothetical protein [Chloroflexota bacterium]
MSRKLLVTVGGLMLFLSLLLLGGVWDAESQGPGDVPALPIVTSATNAVGIGDYVAAEAYAVPAGEDPAEQPLVALIMPYGIYPAMNVMSIDDFVQPELAVEGFTLEWSLEAPEGANPELVEGTVAIFRADVEGEYNLTLTATDEAGTSASTTWTVWATTYVGVGGLAGGAPEFPECGICHTNTGRAWYSTAHASVMMRGLDGEDEFGEFHAEFLPYYTTGFNNLDGADAGGFDDVWATTDWTVPAEMMDGNYSALVADYPQLAAMSGVQCEACHGPGASHPTSVAEGPARIGTGLEYGTCAQCHASEAFGPAAQQWELSGHADKTAQAFWYPIGD